MSVSGSVSHIRGSQDLGPGLGSFGFFWLHSITWSWAGTEEGAGCVLMDSVLMDEAILSFKLLTLVLGSPPPPHGPCSSPNSILALPQTTKLFLPSTLLPILFPAGNALSPALTPFSNCPLSVLPENSPRISGPRPVPPSGPAWSPGSVL